MNAADERYYRQLRADGWRAMYALRAVRDRAWVAANVATDRNYDSPEEHGVLVEMEYDADYTSDDMDEEMAAADRAAIAAGEYEPYIVSVYRPRVVLGTYGAYVDGWETTSVDALCGVCVDGADDPYAVDIIADMARGVLQ